MNEHGPANLTSLPEHRVVSGEELLGPKSNLSDFFALYERDGCFHNGLSLLNLGGIMLGGHLGALGIKAAWMSASDAMPVAAHVLFVAGPDARQPCDLHVNAIRDGQRLAHRSTAIKQAERLCSQVTTTLARPAIAENGPTYRHSAPAPQVPAPGSLPNRLSLLDCVPDEENSLRRKLLQGYPFLDIRPVPHDVGENGRGLFWVRATEAQELSAIDQRCLFALMTDFWFSLPIHHLPGAIDSMGANFVSTSLDHGLWFHGQPNCAEWILFDMSAIAAGDGLASMQGQAWAENGQRIASFAQVALLIPSD